MIMTLSYGVVNVVLGDFLFRERSKMTEDRGGEIAYLLGMCGGDCNWFLIGLTEGEMTHLDGCWSSLDDVCKALYLREQIRYLPVPEKWLAVHIVENIVPTPYPVNEEAVSICNEMLSKHVGKEK